MDERFEEDYPFFIPVDKSPDESQQIYPYCGSGLCGGRAVAAVEYSGDMIVGGSFTEADGQPVNHIARWDGSAWHSIGVTIGGVYSSAVYAFCVYNGELIVGGRFEGVDNISTGSIAAWDGTSWHALGGGLAPLSGTVYDLCVYDEQLIVAGNFDSAGGVSVNDLAAWNGSEWYDLPGLDADEGMMVGALTVYDGKLIAAGNFDYPPGRVAAWNGTSWGSLGVGFNSGVANALIEFNGLLIAGGSFAIDGVTAYGIAAWNGSGWSAIGSGISNEVSNYQTRISCLHVHDGNVIAGGYFSDMDNIRVNHIAAWDGTTWSPLGSGMGDNYDDYANPVYGLTRYDGQLIAVGDFMKIRSAPANRVAGWNGLSWNELTAGGLPFAFMVEPGGPFGEFPHGEPVAMNITKVGGTENMYGFDLLIGYETDALTLTGVAPGPLFDIPGDFEWDYFEYRDGEFEGCDSGCPSGLVRIVGVAEIDDGSEPAVSFDIPAGTPLATFDFTITEDTTINCINTPIEFFWIDCGDNAVALEAGTLGVSNSIWQLQHTGWEDIADPGAEFPTNLGVPDSCLSLGENPPNRIVNFIDLFIPIRCYHDPSDWRGDVNVNGITFEIADLVMLTNYFMYGFSAFGNHIESSIANSDANRDGIVLDIADMRFLQLVVCGAVPPSIGPVPVDTTDTVTFTQDLLSRTVSVDGPDSLGAVSLVFGGRIEPTFLLDTTVFTCYHNYNGRHTVVVITSKFWSNFCDTVLPSGSLFTYSGDGILELEDEQFRKTAASTGDGEAVHYLNIHHVITGGDGGAIGVAEYDPIPRSLARISGSETITLYTGIFENHMAGDVDAATIRVNDSLIPSSVTVIPSSPFSSEPHLVIVVDASDFLGGYDFARDSTYAIWYDVPDLWQYGISVSGTFTDASAFRVAGAFDFDDDTAFIPVPGGWPTINDAVDAAINGDIIEVSEGTYAGDGNRDISVDNKSLHIRSLFGPDSTIIDCGGAPGAPHFAFAFSDSGNGGGGLLEGFTIRNAYTDDNAAVCIQNAAPEIRHCTFENNQSTGIGGALRILGASPTINLCVFDGNHAGTGGAIAISGTGTPFLAHCTFVANSADASGGGLYAIGAAPSVTNCIFAYGTGGGAIAFGSSTGPQSITCTDIYGNAGGDWTGPIADRLGMDGNISVPPLFCDLEGGDYLLDGASPCLPYNNTCFSLIGAYGLGCGVVCGDMSGDGWLNIADPVFLINYLYYEGPAPTNTEVSDTNNDGQLDIGDAVAVINFIFKGGLPLECFVE